MEQDKFCNQCDKKVTCQDAFKRLGEIQGPSIVKKVLVAFVMPLAVFIVVLVILQQALEKYIETEGLRTGVSVLSAFCAAAACVLIFHAIGRRITKS